MIRSLVLFTHVVGVLALFVGLGLEWIGLDGIQRSTTRAEALPWLRLIAIVPRLFGIGVGGDRRIGLLPRCACRRPWE